MAAKSIANDGALLEPAVARAEVYQGVTLHNWAECEWIGFEGLEEDLRRAGLLRPGDCIVKGPRGVARLRGDGDIMAKRA